MTHKKTSKGFGVAMKLAFKDNWLLMVVITVASIGFGFSLLYRGITYAIELDETMKI